MENQIGEMGDEMWPWTDAIYLETESKRRELHQKSSQHGLPEYMMDKANELLCSGAQVPVAATVPYGLD